MVQSKVNQPNWVQYVSLIVLVLLAVGLYMNYTKETTIEQQEVPSAEEIAGVVIDNLNISTPEVDMSKVDSLEDSVGEIYDELFEGSVEELKEEGFRVAVDEFDEEDLEDFLEDNIEDYDELEDYDLADDYDDDEVDYEIVALGLGKDEDKKVIVEITLDDVRVDIDNDVDDKEVDVKFTCEVTFDEGDFSDEGVECELSL